jgi:hypothetical protein
MIETNQPEKKVKETREEAIFLRLSFSYCISSKINLLPSNLIVSLVSIDILEEQTQSVVMQKKYPIL